MATTSVPQITADTLAKPANRVRLDYLDGLRGLAALYVVLNHTSLMAMRFNLLHPLSPRLSKLFEFVHFVIFSYGIYAVCVFIVLSGYCLMIPIIRSADESLRGGLLDFVKRRARRIVPPYYAALALCLILFAAAPFLHLKVQAMPAWSILGPIFSPASLLAHLTLMHCWTPAYIARIDPPMWSVTVEWNIYFFFALLLLPLYKRWGVGALLSVTFILGLLPHYLLGPLTDKAHPWMLSLFALGMVGAVINFSAKPALQGWGERYPWGLFSALFGITLVTLNYFQRKTYQHVHALHWLRQETWGSDWPFETLAGLASVCMIIAFTQKLINGNPPPKLLKVFSSPAAVMLGVFSYSIYLIHDPILETLFAILAQHHISTGTAVLIMFFGGVPSAIFLAYLFHIAFEKRFLPSHFRKVEKRLALGEEAVKGSAIAQ